MAWPAELRNAVSITRILSSREPLFGKNPVRALRNTPGASRGRPALRRDESRARSATKLMVEEWRRTCCDPHHRTGSVAARLASSDAVEDAPHFLRRNGQAG